MKSHNKKIMDCIFGILKRLQKLEGESSFFVPPNRKHMDFLQYGNPDYRIPVAEVVLALIEHLGLEAKHVPTAEASIVIKKKGK